MVTIGPMGRLLSLQMCPTQRAHETGPHQPPDSCQIQLRGKGVRLHIGGVLLGLSLSNILQGRLPPLGVHGRRPSSKSLCHQAAQRSETQMMF